MSRVRVHNFSISLDGFATGEGQALDTPFGHAGHRLHEWMFATRSAAAKSSASRVAPRVSITRWPTGTDPGSVRRSWARASSALRAGRTTRSGAGGGAPTRRSTRRRTS
jgi:hypothetical protein